MNGEQQTGFTLWQPSFHTSQSARVRSHINGLVAYISELQKLCSKPCTQLFCPWSFLCLFKFENSYLSTFTFFLFNTATLRVLIEFLSRTLTYDWPILPPFRDICCFSCQFQISYSILLISYWLTSLLVVQYQRVRESVNDGNGQRRSNQHDACWLSTNVSTVEISTHARAQHMFLSFFLMDSFNLKLVIYWTALSFGSESTDATCYSQ